MSYKINARHLVLDLMYASQQATVSIKRMLCAAQLLGISENSLRIAVTRLNQEQVIAAVARGRYQLVNKKFDSSVISLSKTPQMQLAEVWDHSYLMAYTGHLGRVDRTALAKREKTLHYYGFQPLEQNLYLRPNNLGLSLSALHQHMVQFGCEAALRLFQVNALEPMQAYSQLWQISRLNQQYHDTIQQIQAWFSTLPDLPLEQAAISSFHVGKAGIFTLRSDPLLPREWIDVAAREQCEKAVQRIEQQGLQLWEAVFDQYGV